MNVSILTTLAEIKDFVKWCKHDENLAGFNVVVGVDCRKSYVVGKTADSLRPRYILPIWMDWTNPVERPLIANAINEALYGKPLSPEEMEKEMICKSEKY